MSPRFAALAALAMVWSSACSWQRFDEVTDDTPVLLLKVPSGIRNAGTAVSAIRKPDGSTSVLASGQNGYALYDFGSSEPKSTNAIARGSCQSKDNCFIAQGSAAVFRADEGVNHACFAFAVTLDNAGRPRTTLHCEDQLELGLEIPEPARTLFSQPSAASMAQLRFASGPRREPTRLLAVAPEAGALWYYPAVNAAGVAIARHAQVTASYGKALAVMDAPLENGATGATLVIGEPESNRVHFLSVDDSGTARKTACLLGPQTDKDFGSILSAGYFSSRDTQGLSIGSLSSIFVLPSLARIAQLTGNEEACVPIGDLAETRTLKSDSFGLPAPVESALARGSFAAADLNSDGIDELVVGVPAAAAFGESTAGQLLTLSWAERSLVIREHWSPSAAESGDRFGESVTAIPLGRPDVVLAGAPGGNKLAAFYCSALLPEGNSVKRCN